MLRSTNPTLKSDTFDFDQNLTIEHLENSATINGLVEKSLAILGLILTSGYFTWGSLPMLSKENSDSIPLLFGSSLMVCISLAWLTIVKKHKSGWLVPAYAFFKGIMLAALFYLIGERFRGYAVQLILSSASVFFWMLLFYRTRVIRLSHKFKLGLASSFAGFLLVYAASFIASFFNVHIPYIHEGPLWMMAINAVVFTAASIGFLMDFELIHQNIKSYSPKYMEWYCAFSLVVMWLWVYVGFVKLIRKERNFPY